MNNISDMEMHIIEIESNAEKAKYLIEDIIENYFSLNDGEKFNADKAYMMACYSNKYNCFAGMINTLLIDIKDDIKAINDTFQSIPVHERTKKEALQPTDQSEL